MTKKRYWACVLYPESLPDDWSEYISLSGLSCCLSPLHDKDLNPDNTEKKPHYHLLICYDGPTTYNCVESFVKYLNGTIPIPIESPKGYYRYLTHKDNPEKYQYSSNDIRSFGGFDILNYSLSNSDTQFIMSAIEDIIIAFNIKEYVDLIMELKNNYDPEYLIVLRTHTIHFSVLLRSMRYRGGTTTAPISDL